MIGSKGFRSAEELADAGVHQNWQALHTAFDVRFHAFPVGLDLIETEVRRNPVDSPWCRHRLEETEHDLACFFARINATAGVAEDRQLIVHTVYGFGDQVVMLRRLQWNIDAEGQAELAPPHTGTQHDDIGAYLAFTGAHADGAGVLDNDIVDRSILENLHASLPRALG